MKKVSPCTPFKNFEKRGLTEIWLAAAAVFFLFLGGGDCIEWGKWEEYLWWENPYGSGRKIYLLGGRFPLTLGLVCGRILLYSPGDSGNVWK